MPQPVFRSGHWVPPDLPFYKANFDGALFRDSSSAGIGVVVKDFEGNVIGALSEQIGLPASVVEVEALAYRRAVSFAIEIGLQEVVSEGDSKTIISSLNSDCSCLAHFVHLVEDCRVHAGNLRFSAFTHVRRIYNVVADKLAKKARYLLLPQFWLEDIPVDVSPFVTQDRNFMSNH